LTDQFLLTVCLLWIEVRTGVLNMGLVTVIVYQLNIEINWIFTFFRFDCHSTDSAIESQLFNWILFSL